MPPSPRLYLDANATTPIDPGVRQVVFEAMDRFWANPSSVHGPGREARVALDDARERVAAVLGCRPAEVVFTSGGTEANNLALFGLARQNGARGAHLAVSSIEHPAVLAAARCLARREGFSLTEIPADRAGRITLEAVRAAVRAETILVCVMAANNEVGSVQDIARIADWCRERGLLLHCDAVQFLGKLPWPGWDRFPADSIALCAHKFFGPKGVGALILRSPRPLSPVALGGSQELDRRAGTENLPAILGLAAALERFVGPPVFEQPFLRDATRALSVLLDGLPGVVRLSPDQDVLPNTISFAVEGTDSLALLAALDMAGLCASSGSACSAGALLPSHVVRAMGFSDGLASSLVRFSVLPTFGPADLAWVVKVLPGILARCRGCS